MRAVWSFWSKPFRANSANSWFTVLHHFLGWGVSVRAASRHYPDTALVTDRAGKRLLIDLLGLAFKEVRTDLDRLDAVDPAFWALGKLVAYSLQDRPFVHLDTDVFLWKPLPRQVAEAPVFTQYPEGFSEQDVNYRPRDIEWAFAEESLKLPAEWQWARSSHGFSAAENCGILGGSHLKFLSHYARTAIDLVMRPENQAAWARLNDKQSYNLVLEQFFLAACANFHRAHAHSPYPGVRLTRLFASWEEAFDPNRSAHAGFTHLLGGAKCHPAVARKLEERVRREDPAYFQRCAKLAAAMSA